MSKKASTEGVSIRATFSTLDGVDLSKVRSRADFAAIYDRLFKEALRAVPFIDSKQRLEGIECARRCVDSWAKCYKDYIQQDFAEEIERQVNDRVDATVDAMAALEGVTLTKQHIDTIRAALQDSEAASTEKR